MARLLYRPERADDAQSQLASIVEALHCGYCVLLWRRDGVGVASEGVLYCVEARGGVDDLALHRGSVVGDGRHRLVEADEPDYEVHAYGVAGLRNFLESHTVEILGVYSSVPYIWIGGGVFASLLTDQPVPHDESGLGTGDLHASERMLRHVFREQFELGPRQRWAGVDGVYLGDMEADGRLFWRVFCALVRGYWVVVHRGPDLPWPFRSGEYGDFVWVVGSDSSRWHDVRNQVRTIIELCRVEHFRVPCVIDQPPRCSLNTEAVQAFLWGRQAHESVLANGSYWPSATALRAYKQAPELFPEHTGGLADSADPMPAGVTGQSSPFGSSDDGVGISAGMRGYVYPGYWVLYLSDSQVTRSVGQEGGVTCWLARCDLHAANGAPARWYSLGLFNGVAVAVFDRGPLGDRLDGLVERIWQGASVVDEHGSLAGDRR